MADYKRMSGKRKSRYLYLWLSRQVAGVAIYRFERGMLQTLGNAWQIIRIPFLPLLNIVYFYSNCEINYHADIGPGLCVLHTPLGVVVSGNSIIGRNFTLTGGNLVGIKSDTLSKKIIIGNNVNMGANAVIIGPVIVGNNVTVGASACVVKNAEDGAVLAGVPAKNIRRPVYKMFPEYSRAIQVTNNIEAPFNVPVSQSFL
jgi:serine O-acetyltransferase